MNNFLARFVVAFCECAYQDKHDTDNDKQREQRQNANQKDSRKPF
jgi:hypothetical protein